MKHLFAAFVLGISFLAGCNAVKPTTSQTIRVLTYNIHHANPPSEREGVIKLAAIADVIKSSKADIVGIQELDSVTDRSGHVYQLKELAQMLHMHYFFAKGIPYGGGSYGVGILSRFPLSAATVNPLPKQENINSESRVLALATVQLPHNKRILFGCTHLDVNNEANREMQVEKILQLTSNRYPVVIAGDFNAKSGSRSLQKLQSFYVNASAKNEPTIPNIRPDKKIDFIFYAKENNFRLTGERVMTEATYESDHLPFWADLEIR